MKNLTNFHKTVETGVDQRRAQVTNRSESKLIRSEHRAYVSGHQQIIDTGFIILHTYSIFENTHPQKDLHSFSVLILLNADLSQASISLFLKLNWIPVFDLIKYRKRFLLFIVLLNPNAPKCLRNRFQFLCDSRGPEWAVLQASLYDLKVPCPHNNSGKRTLACSATRLFT